MSGRLRRGLSRTLVDGGLAGLAGGVAMIAVSRLVPRQVRTPAPLGRLVPVDDGGPRDPAEVAAERIGDRLGLDPGEQVDRLLGGLLRVLLGVACGAGYGLAVEYLPGVRPGTGATIGALLWLGVDEAVAPLVGLSQRLRPQSSAERLYAVAPDIAYGVVTDVCLELLRRRRRP